MAKVIRELLEQVGQSFDTAMIYLDQELIKDSLDILVTLTEFIREHSHDDLLNDLNQEMEHPMKGDQKPKENKSAKPYNPRACEKNLPNILRRLVLRIQPYISISSQP